MITISSSSRLIEELKSKVPLINFGCQAEAVGFQMLQRFSIRQFDVCTENPFNRF
jgi:hypothetical protein